MQCIYIIIAIDKGDGGGILFYVIVSVETVSTEIN